MLFEGRYKTQDYFRYFLHLFSVPPLIFFRKMEGGIFLLEHVYIDLLKLKAYELFENSDADLSWLLFLKKPTCRFR